MVHEFDVKTFLQNIKATKPPYQCPFEGCGKPYKTYIGMRFHIYNYDHVNNTGIVSPDGDKSSRKRGQWHHRQTLGRSPSPPDFLRTSNREALTYAEAQKMVEFDVDGKIYRINISEPLDIVHVDGKNGDTPINGINCDLSSKKVSSDSQLAANVSSINAKTPAKEGRATKPGKSSKTRQQPISKTPQLPQASLTLKLPEPSFRLIEDYEPPDAPPKASSYHRYIEKSVEDIDEEIEYDMDEEDTAWLDLVNKMRKEKKMPEIPADVFELLMDRLEKESYFQSQNSGKDVGPAIDEDAVCCICNDGECQNSNAILFCDMCNLAVHQECYGVPYIPEGQWLCRRCLQSPSRAVDCVLCPNKGGAFKQTDDNRWSHVVCALWIPEVCFANTVFLEPIDSIDNIPQARWKLSCYVCKQRGVGACIQCHKANCYVAFHVTCAQQAGLYMKMEAVKEMTASGLVTNVRKAAYCDAHTPADENGTTLSNVYSSGEEDSRTEQKRVQQTKAKFKEKMKKARKILAEKRSALPIVSIPTIPIDRLTKIASMITIPKRNLFLQRLLGYWTLKRQSRNGVPLLRRLQISHNGLKKDCHKDGDDEHIVKLKEHLKCLNRLRQDLEKARLLVELIRKREKLKREYLRIHQSTVELQLNPYKVFLLDLVSRLEEKDVNQFFTDPVNTDEVKDYLQFIKNPMDFSTLRQNVMNNKYFTYEAFEADFELIIKNCIFYNEKDTVYNKAAVKLRETTANILKDARKKFELYDTDTGLHDPPVEDDIKVGQVLSTVTENQRLESKLKQSEQALAKAKQTKSGGTRTKRVRSLTAEIIDIKRQIKLNTSRVNSEQSLSSLPQTYQAISSNTNTNTKTTTNTTNIRSVDNKKHNKRKSAKVKNSIANSDTDNTDICDNLAVNHHNIDVKEVRKTFNSSSNSINASIDNVINSFSVSKSNAIANKESPKRSKVKTPRTEKTVNKQEIVENGSDTNINKTASHSRTNNRKRKITDTSLSSISPKSIASTSPVLNVAKFNLDKSLSLRNKNQLSSKLIASKTATVDASTCTPPNMFTETAESFAREQASRGQSGQTSGAKRRSNRNSSRASKRHQTSSNSAINLIDTSIPFPAIMPQTESFSVYRNFVNSPADSDINSETSQSQSSTVSSKSSGSTTSHTNSSASLGSSGTSSRVSVNGLQNNKRKSNERPRSRSSRSDISIENQKIPLQPNDVVWAKCSGYPWYPALIVNPDTSELSSNGSIIPVPPKDVLALRLSHDNTQLLYLVSFFDTKRSWQWLPRNKLEPLGIDNIDNVKLAESKKANERKAVQKAFKSAIEFAVLLKKNMCDQSSNGE